MLEGLLKILNEELWEKLKEEEGITKKDVEMVDLDIAFSPVTPYKGASSCDVITKTIGGDYIIDGPMGKETISPELLRIMRYRYLVFDPIRVQQAQMVEDYVREKGNSK